MKNQVLKTYRVLRTTSKLLGLSLIAGVMSNAALAQTTFTLGTGTGTNSNVPITSNYGYNYTQQIMYASELTAQGSAAGNIQKIRFFLNSGSPTFSDGWRVLIGHTTKTQFTSNTDWEVIGNLTEVFNGTVTFPAGGNWLEITLTTPFVWNGTSNIVVAVDENTPSFGSLVPWNHTTTTGVNRSIYYRNDSNNPDPASPPTATGRVTSYANMQVVMTPSNACAGTPAAATTVASAASVCEGNTTTITANLNNGFFQSGISYQWQKNDGSGWTDVIGATTASYSNPPLTVTTAFRANVTCANSLETTPSIADTVFVNPTPVVTLNTTSVAMCPGEPANLMASGATTYVWSPTPVSPNATSANITALPSTTTTYTVTGTTNGCSSTASAVVTPIASVKGAVSYDPSENCEPGSIVTIDVANLPATITNGGVWEYRWLDANGNQIQDWSTTNNYTFIPAEDSLYTHYYQLRSSSCPDDAVDSVVTSIAIGFGADVDLTHYDCNTMEGIIELSDVFAQVEITELYANDLSSPTNVTGLTLTGNAAITNGRAQLTNNAASLSGFMQVAVPNNLGANNSMNVSFLMTADMPFQPFGTGGGDGIAYSFGNDAIPTANGSGHNGKGTKLRLSFDAAPNGTENGNAAGIYLVYGWTATNAYGPASAQTLAYSSNTALWKGQTNVPVTFSINAEGKATVTVGGVTIFSNIQLPVAYTTADVSTWSHLFSAATGGDALRQGISNLSIEAGAPIYGITPGNVTTAPITWQNGTTFDGLLPGLYNVWISKNETADCSKNIGTFEILNNNPVVALGNDTTICEGETLTLDAGNPGSVYTWSNSNTYTQTLDVTTAGNYVVYVTNPDGCLGIGSINVDVNEAPSGGSIFVQENDPSVTVSAVGVANAGSYSWNFGDGQTVANGPATITHTYVNNGPYTVTLTITNDCGTSTLTAQVNNTAAIGENTIEGLEIYPNPASDIVTISLPNNETSEVSVYSLSGAKVGNLVSFNTTAKVDVAGWEKGVYFLHITNQGQSSVSKLVVQ